ncbi:hypothetical protein GCM10017668_46290 [Streptomyces tuirus]|uniref:Uncharacterized protein n=1 Tax=Streptomyces tuirus TaxID=68278 RepID=A0A7G1NMM0_9ACTN|nr:hypothetical protein GCM10017668_46290 [Streptomyces tuirus]
MPDPTPNLHAANTAFHKEVRNQPELRGRTPTNAPSAHLGATGPGHTADVTVDLGKRRPVARHAPHPPTAIRTASV